MDSYSSVAAALAATTALLLAAVHFCSRSQAMAAGRLVARWRRIDERAAFLIVATLTGLATGLASGWSFSKPDSAAQQVENTPAPLQASTSENGEAGDAGQAGRDSALDELRAFAKKIEERRQSIVALDASEQASEAKLDSLPDVDTMIQRLAKRLESQPDDAYGWRMLGWSHLNTNKPEAAVEAYEHALALDPKSAEAAAGLSEAKTKAAAAQVQAPGNPSSLAGSETGAPVLQNSPAPTTTDAPQQIDMIRDMVERLARRLESQPQDEGGWVRLIRARTVLGEMDMAREALRKGLAAFASNAPARERISQVAKENGLSAY